MEQLEHRRIWLERVHLDARIDRDRDERVEAGVGADVENEPALGAHERGEHVRNRTLEPEPAVRRHRGGDLVGARDADHRERMCLRDRRLDGDDVGRRDDPTRELCASDAPQYARRRG